MNPTSSAGPSWVLAHRNNIGMLGMRRKPHKKAGTEPRIFS